MPGLQPSVFLLPLTVIIFLAGILSTFYYNHPEAVPPVEADSYEEETVDSRPEEPPFFLVHYDRIVPIVIAVLFYFLALWRLSYPPKQVFDEVHHVRTAMEFVWGMDPHEWTHPHISKLLQAESMELAHEYFDPSDEVWSSNATFSPRAALAWRLPSVIFGTLALLGQYTLARALFKNRAVATLSMLFLALDGVFFVQSRIAMTNIFTVCFIIWGAWAAWRWKEEQQVRHILGMGTFLGLAIATRWSSLYAYALLVLFILVDGVIRWQKTGWKPGFFFGRAALFITTLILVPLVIYAASYIPYVLQGNGTMAQKLLSWNYNSHGWGKVLSQQGDMYRYHSTLQADHPYDSPAWSWPFMLRPVWYFFEQTGPAGKEAVRGIWCIGNAFVWWAILPTMAVGTWLSIRRRSSNLGMLCLLCLGQWFCWLAKARGLNFLHYLFEAIPFVCIALAYFMTTLWCQESATARMPTPEGEEGEGEYPFQWRIIVASYVVAIVIWFVFYYPLLAASPISTEYLQKHYWLGNIWI